MFKRIYNSQDVPATIKSRAREYVKTFIIYDTIPYLEAFLGASIAIIEYYEPIILSYIDTEMPDNPIIKNEEKMNQMIAQLIRIRLLDEYLVKKQYDPSKISFDLREDEKDTKKYPLFPYGFYLIDSIIPESTCNMYSVLFSKLYLEEKTNDQKYSLTGKDEEWGDLAPNFLQCLYYYLYESILEEDPSYKISSQAVYSTNEEINLSFYPSDSTYSDVATIVFFSSCILRGKEVSAWRKKEEDSFETRIDKGSIIILKKASLYEWKYTISDNKGVLIIK